MISIKDELPTSAGWYFCKFYNNTFGGFRVRCLSQVINQKNHGDVQNNGYTYF